MLIWIPATLIQIGQRTIVGQHFLRRMLLQIRPAGSQNMRNGRVCMRILISSDPKPCPANPVPTKGSLRATGCRALRITSLLRQGVRGRLRVDLSVRRWYQK
jgi:hypothetical protein